MSKARPDAWMPMYWGDYAKHTGHLSALMHGAYLMLIKHYWCTGGPLPDDDAQLWRIACCDTPSQWKKIRPVIERLFSVAIGVWRHRRVDRELERAVEITGKRAKAAHARWEQAPSKSDAHASAHAVQVDMQTASPSQSQSQEQRKKKEKMVVEADDGLVLAEAQSLWNELARRKGLVRVVRLTDARRSSLRLRLAELGGIEGWKTEVIDAVERSAFLCGANNRGFRASFDFVIKLESFLKIREGKYDDRQSTRPEYRDGFATLLADVNAYDGSGDLRERVPDHALVASECDAANDDRGSIHSRAGDQGGVGGHRAEELGGQMAA